MLMGAILANLYFIKNSISDAKSVSEKVVEVRLEKQLESAIDLLSDTEKDQVDKSYVLYDYSNRNYLEDEEILKKSLLMNVNPQAIPTYNMNYRVKMEDTDVSDLLNVFQDTLIDNSARQEVLALIGEEYSNTVVDELISVADAANENNNIVIAQNKYSGILNVQIYGKNEEQCSQIAELIEERMTSYASELQQLFGTFSIEKISQQYCLSANDELAEKKTDMLSAMNTMYTTMKSSTTGFTENQITYFNLLKESDEVGEAEINDELEESTVQTSENIPVQYFSKKYFFIGLLVGLFLMAMWHACVYIFSHTVKDVDELKQITGVPVFGESIYTDKTNKNNKFDDWIDSLFSKKQQNGENANVIERICHEAQLQAAQKNVKNILITGSSDSIKVKEVKNKSKR